jgi:hypothetical protein
VRAGTGSRADGWAAPLTVYFGPTTILQRQAAIDRAAIDAGRRPADIRRMYGVLGRIAAEHRHAYPFDRRSSLNVGIGRTHTPTMVADELATLLGWIPTSGSVWTPTHL